ncbi:hypothetical protein D3C87_161830 [compost metagenome]
MIRLVSALVLALGVSSQALAVDKAYFEIKKVTVRDVTAQYAQNYGAKTGGLNADCNSAQGQANVVDGKPLVDGNPLGVVEIFVDQIINIGKKIWAIVDAGRPVVNVKIDVAHALPKGLSCWSDLSGWQMPQSKVYNVNYENGLGMTILDYSYRVTFTAGGNADGVGQYITNATFQPAEIYVAWGFNFGAEAQVPSVFNMGSKTSPVAGMQMDMKWHFKSPLAHNEMTETFFVSGKNELVHME